MLQRLSQHPRTIYAFVLFACLSLLATGYVFQYWLDLEPCPLCMVQRLVFMAMSLIALIGLLHASKGMANKIYSILIGLFALVGASVATRQVWLQSLPPEQVPACGPDFSFIINHLPILKALETLWRGSGSCSEVQWQFLGLSIAGWALIWFGLFIGLAIYQGTRHNEIN